MTYVFPISWMFNINNTCLFILKVNDYGARTNHSVLVEFRSVKTQTEEL